MDEISTTIYPFKKKKKRMKELTTLIQTNDLHALSSRNRVEKRKREERERENEESNSA